MGGGSDLDEAFRYLCEKGKGGDFLILRARGSADYNPYIKKLCKVNSVGTLVIPDRTSAANPKVVEIIRTQKQFLSRAAISLDTSTFGKTLLRRMS